MDRSLQFAASGTGAAFFLQHGSQAPVSRRKGRLKSFAGLPKVISQVLFGAAPLRLDIVVEYGLSGDELGSKVVRYGSPGAFQVGVQIIPARGCGVHGGQ